MLLDAALYVPSLLSTSAGLALSNQGSFATSDVYYCNSMRSDRKQFLFLGKAPFPDQAAPPLPSLTISLPVSLVTTLEIVHLVFISHTAYFWLADGFGDVERLGQTPWSGSVLPALNGFGARHLFFV